MEHRNLIAALCMISAFILPINAIVATASTGSLDNEGKRCDGKRYADMR